MSEWPGWLPRTFSNGCTVPEAVVPPVVDLNRADLLRRLGRAREAAGAYRVALDLAPAEAERRFLRERLRTG